jgi:hypothetical protein
MAKKRSQRRAAATPQTTGQPLAMTQEELDAKVEGAATPALDRRIRRSAASKPIGKLRTKKFTPAPISKQEMAQVQRVRRLSKTLSRRIQKFSEQDTSVTAPDESKQAPTRPAARKRRKG